MALLSEFKEQIIYRLDESTRMVSLSLEQLSEDDIWTKTNMSTNSIGNLIIHLCGNMTQYVIASQGKMEDIRNRDEEFSIKGGYNKTELLEKLKETVREVKAIIADLSEAEYLRKRHVQGFNFSGIGIVIHVTEHYSYHTGQIAYLTKTLKNKDLGFYSGIDLNIKNED
ncbi:DinB family protein [Seonamhaeicola sp.]|uniref:DinB family protein n=1 Tax=Seonamhaeicola sp. TaxID=1912245 RepID=UPI00261AFA58|nr:DinB family protein [Seonamhaeicola sp.]